MNLNSTDSTVGLFAFDVLHLSTVGRVSQFHSVVSVGIHEEHLKKKPNDLQAFLDELSDIRRPGVVFVSEKVSNEKEKGQREDDESDANTESNEKMNREASD